MLRKAEPGLTEGELRKRLGAAMELGLPSSTRCGVGWEIRQDPRRDFHAKHDFGFSWTDFAGTAAGEIGGTFWRTEAVDPWTRITRPKR